MDWYFRVDNNKCTACGGCVYACKFLGEDLLYMGETRPWAEDEECMFLCMDCDGHCFDTCPNDAISIGKD